MTIYFFRNLRKPRMTKLGQGVEVGAYYPIFLYFADKKFELQNVFLSLLKAYIWCARCCSFIESHNQNHITFALSYFY